MTKLAILLALLPWAAPSHIVEIHLESLRKASTYEEVAKVAARIEEVLPADEKGGRALQALCVAFARFGRIDEARDVVVTNVDRLKREHRSLPHAALADLLDRAGRLDEAIVEARRALRMWTTDTQNPSVGGIRVLLAKLLEKKGEWKEALELWAGAEFKGSWCGTCVEGQKGERLVAMFRCRFHLGERMEALTGIAGMLLERDRLGASQGRCWPLYLELSARAGRLDAARKLLSGQAKKIRVEFKGDLAVVAGFAEKKPASIIAALESDGKPRRDIRRWDRAVSLAAKFLGELGRPAIEELSRRIVFGSEVAVLIAEEMRETALLPALRDRLAIATHGRSDIERAILRINRRARRGPR
jgi:tetratricopeptide (TPR) repeat protein